MYSISVAEPDFGMYLHHTSDGMVGPPKVKQIIIPIHKKLYLNGKRDIFFLKGDIPHVYHTNSHSLIFENIKNNGIGSVFSFL